MPNNNPTGENQHTKGKSGGSSRGDNKSGSSRSSRSGSSR